MLFFKKPTIIILFLAVLSFFSGLLGDGVKSIVIEVWTLVLIWFIAVMTHEVGHVLFGLIAKLKFQFLVVGPITVRSVNNKLKISENKSWLYFGGIVLFSPYSFEDQSLSKKWAIMTIGGPLISLFNFLLFFSLYKMIGSNYLLNFYVLHFLILIATIIPIKTKSYMTDGAMFLILLKNNNKAKQHLFNVLIAKELLSDKRPRDWQPEIINVCCEQNKVIEDINKKISEVTLLFYYFADKGKFEKARSILKPINKESISNNIALGFLHSSYIACEFLDKEEQCDLENMTTHFQAVSKFDLYSYYRSLAIIKYLEEKHEIVLKYVQKAEKELATAEKGTLGFWSVERQLFEDIKVIILNEGKRIDIEL